MATQHASKDADPPGGTKLLWPRIAPCDKCGHEVLYVRRTRSYNVIKLQPMPVLVGYGPCPVCRSIPGVPCNSCNNGVRGELLTSKHVVISLSGFVRPEARMVKPWDSAYHRHACRP